MNEKRPLVEINDAYVANTDSSLPKKLSESNLLITPEGLENMRNVSTLWSILGTAALFAEAYAFPRLMGEVVEHIADSDGSLSSVVSVALLSLSIIALSAFGAYKEGIAGINANEALQYSRKNPEAVIFKRSN